MNLIIKKAGWPICLFVFSIVLLNRPARAVFFIPGNIVQNNDFSYWPTGLGPADWTYTVNIGVFQYGGLIYGSVSQELTTIPGQTYQLQFATAGNPNDPAPETLDVYWENNLLGSTTWYPDGPGYANFQYIEGSFTMQATTSTSLLTFVNAGSYTTGAIAILTDIGVVPTPEPSIFVLAGMGAYTLIGLGRHKNTRVIGVLEKRR
jgi:hypothetical protein